MSIPMGGFAALLVVATFALTSCGGDDGASSTPAAVTETATVTQTAKAQAAAPSTASTQQGTTAATTAKGTQTTAKQRSKTTAAKTPSSGGGSSRCGPVEIGARDFELIYARITAQRGVSCQTVTIIAQQWGAQRIGTDKALLPDGWECSGNSCSGPRGGFSFKLFTQQE